MQRTRIHTLLSATKPCPAVRLAGWIRTRRESKGFAFLELNDGSCLGNIQVILDEGKQGWEQLAKMNTGASIEVHGALIASLGKGQQWEIQAEQIEVLGEADPNQYPLQKKQHSDEFLRSIAHLRSRTNKFGAAFRIRSETAFAVHEFFREQGYYYVHTPILTGSDCEGAGEQFTVTTLPFTRSDFACNNQANQDSQDNRGEQNPFSTDFFGQQANLTVSGQLEAETLAMGLGQVYTFGPTFRAENSNTARHAAEFWMIEPEAAFMDLQGLMQLAEDLTRSVTQKILARCEADLGLFNRFVDKELLNNLATIAENAFDTIDYADAITILLNSGKKFEYKPHFGIDLQTEHERFLAEEYCKKPVIVYNYPKDIKAFYMRLNDDNTTVAAMDLLVPRIGELIGGSQREDRFNVLEKRIAALGQNPEDYWWYLDLRRFGSVPHAGFGLGFERLLMMLTGITNIRDVIPFPRTPGNLHLQNPAHK